MAFSISFSRPMKVLMGVLGMGPSHSAIDVQRDGADVRMGWAFHVVLPRSAIVAVRRASRRSMSRGVHGFAGRYLVNGSGDGLVTITVDPPQRARMVGFPLTVRELTVSVGDPDGLIAALG
jgi:hypothetical protein